jgi:hypothetical protein
MISPGNIAGAAETSTMAWRSQNDLMNDERLERNFLSLAKRLGLRHGLSEATRICDMSPEQAFQHN